MPTFQEELHLGRKTPLIETDDLADGLITTDKIADGAVTTDKLEDEAVTTEKIEDAAVTTEKIEDDAITEAKILDEAVTWDKLSEDVKKRIKVYLSTISLGFYHDDDPPTPMLMVQVRPRNVNETIVPYLLLAQQDMSDLVTEWKWERDTGNETADLVWNNSSKASQRTFNLTSNDLPTGWYLSEDKISFKCTATFTYESIEAEIINSVTIV